MCKKICCVTGHRDIPADKSKLVKTRLREEIEAAIADGYTTFLSGMAKGVDLLFAELVIEQKAHHPELFLEAAIPYRNRLATTDPVFQKCLAECNGVQVQQEEYSRDCFMNRNRYIVSLSSEDCRNLAGSRKGYPYNHRGRLEKSHGRPHRASPTVHRGRTLESIVENRIAAKATQWPAKAIQWPQCGGELLHFACLSFAGPCLRAWGRRDMMELGFSLL